MGYLGHLPIARGALPFAGHLALLVRDPLSFLTALPSQGDLVQIRIGPVNAVVVCSPDLTRQMLLNDKTFDKGGPIFDSARKTLGDGLPLCPHSGHRRQRRLLQPSFQRDRLREYAKEMVAEIDTITGTWRDGQTLNVPDEMMLITSGALARSMFSGDLPTTEITGLFGEIVSGVYRQAIAPSWISRLTLRDRRYYSACGSLRETLGALITKRRSTDEARKDLLGALLGARIEPMNPGEATSLNDVEIIDELTAFALAGIETTSNTISWVFHELSIRPDLQRSLSIEVDSVLEADIASFGDLSRLDLTRRIILEALRLYPPAWMLTRVAGTDAQLGDYQLPRGTNLVFSPYLIQRANTAFESPDEFDPERWLDVSPQSIRDIFVPFGSGARKCIGDEFAMTLATLALATVAKRWVLHPTSAGGVRPAKLSAILRPSSLRLRVSRRSSFHEKWPGTEGTLPSGSYGTAAPSLFRSDKPC
jgi:pentalenene oxygenase